MDNQATIKTRIEELEFTIQIFEKMILEVENYVNDKIKKLECKDQINNYIRHKDLTKRNFQSIISDLKWAQADYKKLLD